MPRLVHQCDMMHPHMCREDFISFDVVGWKGGGGGAVIPTMFWSTDYPRLSRVLICHVCVYPRSKILLCYCSLARRPPHDMAGIRRGMGGGTRGGGNPPPLEGWGGRWSRTSKKGIEEHMNVYMYTCIYIMYICIIASASARATKLQIWWAERSWRRGRRGVKRHLDISKKTC